MTKTIEDLEQEVSDLEKERDTLREENSDLQMEIDNLEKERDDLRTEVENLEEELEEAEQAPADTDDFTQEELLSAIRNSYGIDSTMLNDMKVEKFFEKFDKISLEQLESLVTP